MGKHSIRLADGSYISSGQEGVAIGSVSLHRTVNNGRELNFGAVCAAVARIELIDGGEVSPIAVGEEFALLGENGAQVGLFTVETAVRTGQGSYRITAYDRIARLEETLDSWLDGLTDWPYTLQSFAALVAQRCDIPLAAGELEQGSHTVRAFSGTNITGRQLIGWMAQIMGAFARANEKGELEFSWYTQAAQELKPAGENAYFAGSLQYEGYIVPPVDRVCLRHGDKAVYYPEEGAYTLTIAGNPLLTGEETALAQTLYEKLQQMSYTPCTVTVNPGQYSPGQWIYVTDSKGNRFLTLVMTAREQAGREVLTSTGSRRTKASKPPATGTGTPVFYGGEWKQITTPQFSMKETVQ